jgi:hypothetical protein
MGPSGRFRFIVALLAAVAAVCPGAVSAASAGIFQFVAGDVRIVPASGSEREARKGSLLNVGDVVVTARRATAQIKMGDGAIVVVQPQSRLQLAVYRFDGREDGSERVVFRLEHGGFRSVTGAIGNTHKNNYLIETPIAHMGVRGTDHESYYFPPGSDAGQPGAYNKVNTGLTFIRTAAGEVVVAPNQVGYAASGQALPALLPGVPEFFNRAVPPRSGRQPAPVPGASPPVLQAATTTTGLSLAEVPAMAPASGSVAGFVERVGGSFFGRSALNPALAPNGAALANAGGDAAWGVDWGSWQGGAATVNGTSASGPVHFAQSTRLTTPAELAVLGANAVNATYSHLGGPAPTNQAGVAGTVNAMSVSVNFAAQAITNYAVSATVDTRTWNASGSGSIAQFTGAGGIALNGTCAGCTVAPSTAATGNAHGAFVGGAAERMISSYGLRSAQHSIAGAALLGR